MGRFRWTRVRTIIRPSTVRVTPLKYEEEYTKTPQYPPIEDTSVLGRQLKKEKEWEESVQSIKTVEEKLMKINMPRFYGWSRTLFLKENKVHFNYLPFVKFITRTHFLDFKDMPSTKLENLADRMAEQIKPQIEEALVFEYKYRSRKYEHASCEEGPLLVSDLDNLLARSVIQQINRILMGNLLNSAPHLLTTQVEVDPRVETFWSVGWKEVPNWLETRLDSKPWSKDLPRRAHDRWFQYFGSPVLHLRHELPLPVVTDMHEAENRDNEGFPNFEYDPKVLGIKHDLRVGTNIPGFWPGDPCEFGLLSYHSRGHLLNRPKEYGDEDKADALHAQAILASYGWLHPQACYQGFSMYNDLTYPLVTQTVVTNGRLWSFYVYQLNTTLMYRENAATNPKYNLCWGTPELKLFEEIADGKVIGFNDDVLKILLKFYLNTPKEREGIEMKPFLGTEERHIADITHEERRAWLEKAFKHMYSGRPRHKALPEIYDWEKIYKIRHQTRPQEPRRRPFELNINPYLRTYDSIRGNYIPKKFREHRKKGRLEKQYYP